MGKGKDGKKLPIETGRYKLIAKLKGAVYLERQKLPREFICLLQVDEYNGWLYFHCTFKQGSIGLAVKHNGAGWICKQANWDVIKVEMIDRKQYISELEKLHVN